MKIFSVHARRTDFLRLQVKALKDFCLDVFEYYCIDNFVDSTESEFIKTECESLGVNYVRFNDYPITGTAFDHTPALNSIKNIVTDDELVVILDFDVFMIDDFSFKHYISDYDISGIYMQRDNFNQEYICPFVVIVNGNYSQLDFGGFNGCDVGGNTQYYIKNKKVKWMTHTSYLNHENDYKCFNIDYDPKYAVQLIESSFIHYFRGTNWDNNTLNFHVEKTEWLQKSLNEARKVKIINKEYLNRLQTIFSYSVFNWNGIEDNYLGSKLNPALNI